MIVWQFVRNKFAKVNSDIEININNKLTLPPLSKLIDLDENKFKEILLERLYEDLDERFIRNALIAGNSKEKALIENIIKKLDHKSTLIRCMAVWALYKLSTKDFLQERQKNFLKKRIKMYKMNGS